MVGNQFRFTSPNPTVRSGSWVCRAARLSGPKRVADRYKGGVGASEIKGLDKSGVFPTYGDVVPPGLKFPNAIKEINPLEGATAVRCDLALERGDTVHVTAVDHESKPVVGCWVTGRVGISSVVEQATFDLENLSLGETRPIVIEQKERGIGKFLLLKFDENTPRTMSITLEPSATLVGRLLDADGVPLGGDVSSPHLPIREAIFGRDFRPSSAAPMARSNTRVSSPAVITMCSPKGRNWDSEMWPRDSRSNRASSSTWAMSNSKER